MKFAYQLPILTMFSYFHNLSLKHFATKHMCRKKCSLDKIINPSTICCNFMRTYAATVFCNKGFVLKPGMILSAQKMKFSITNFFSKCNQIQRKLQIWSHLFKKSLMENFIFCVVLEFVFR